MNNTVKTTAPPNAKKKFKGDIFGSIMKLSPYTIYNESQCDICCRLKKKIRSVGIP
jgi:hypothetical protein